MLVFKVVPFFVLERDHANPFDAPDQESQHRLYGEFQAGPWES